MFNFREFGKLFNYKWLNIFDLTTPAGNESELPVGTYKNIMSGSIFKIVSDILLFVASFILCDIAINATSRLFTGINLYGINDHMSIINYILPIISVLALVYVIAMGKYKQNPVFHFSYGLYTVINFIYLILMMIKCYGAFLIDGLSGIIMVIAIILGFMGNLFILIGCIDFCIKAKDEYREAHKEVERTDIKTSTIGIDDVALHAAPNPQESIPSEPVVVPTQAQPVQVVTKTVVVTQQPENKEDL